MAFNRIPESQHIYQVSDSLINNMKLSGTSTLHNWAMSTKEFKGDAQLGMVSEKITSLKSLTFSLAVLDLKSDKKGLDKNAYKALKAGQYKYISYTLLSATLSHESGNKFQIKAQGHLSIADVTKEVDMDVFCVVNKDATITCTGSNLLAMSDYQITPPSFMMGAMKTGDAITLDFTIVYKKGTGN